MIGLAAHRGGLVILQYVNGLASYKNVTAFGITSKTAAASPNAFKFIRGASPRIAPRVPWPPTQQHHRPRRGR